LNKKIAAAILAVIGAWGANAQGQEVSAPDASLQKKIEQMLLVSKDDLTPAPTNPLIQDMREYTAPPTVKKEAAVLDLTKEIEEEEKTKLAIRLKSDNRSAPAEMKVNVERGGAKVAYQQNLQSGTNEITTQFDTGFATIDATLSNSSRASISANIPLKNGVTLRAGYNGESGKGTAGIEYSRKAVKTSFGHTTYPDGSQRLDLGMNVSAWRGVTASIIHHQLAYASSQDRKTGVSLEKEITHAPLSKVYLSMTHAFTNGISYEEKKIGIEKNLNWLILKAWGHKPTNEGKMYYGAEGKISLSW